MEGVVDEYRIFGIRFTRRKKPLTLKQLQEWEAYNELDPIGKWRDEFGLATLEALIYNLAISIHGKKGAKNAEVMDFLPDWGGMRPEKEPEKQSVEDMKNFLLAFARGQNKKTGIQPRQPKKVKDNGHR